MFELYAILQFMATVENVCHGFPWLCSS